MSFDWVAIGAIATVGLLLVGALQLRNRFPKAAASSKKLEFYVTKLVGAIPENVVKAAKLSESRITADSVLLRNSSGRDLRNIRLRISRRNRIWESKVDWTKSISEHAIVLSIEGDTILVVIDDFPADEKLAIQVIANDWAILDLQIRSENSSVTLVEAAKPFSRYR